ncbi:hypothetical protein D1872_255460 [compost metagenome]
MDHAAKFHRAAEIVKSQKADKPAIPIFGPIGFLIGFAGQQRVPIQLQHDGIAGFANALQLFDVLPVKRVCNDHAKSLPLGSILAGFWKKSTCDTISPFSRTTTITVKREISGDGGIEHGDCEEESGNQEEF